MSQGLSVSRLISVGVNLSPAAAKFANINSTMILGDSDVIDTASRIRSYSTLGGVATDFGTSAPEYAAAALYFSQVPAPTQLYIGRWASTAVAGRLLGASLTAAQQLLSVFTPITNGGFKIQVDAASTPVNITGLNFSGAGNLNAVATIINTALTTASVGATVTWNASYGRFEIRSATTGTASKVLPLTAPTSGTNIVSTIGGGTGSTEVDGIAAETALSAVTLLDGLSTYFYGITVASPLVADADHVAIAAYIQAAANPHLYGVSTAEATAINPTSSSDIGSVLAAAGYTRTFVSYSSTTLYVAASLFGRMMAVDFTGSNTAITLAFQQEPGVTPETLNAAQAATLDAKRYNYFVNYNNSTAINSNGTCAGPAYIDEIFGLDSAANTIQTNVYNVLYASGAKIPQTDAGNGMLAAAMEAACEQYVSDGLFAPGTWTSGGFGSLNTGDFMPKGYYIYQPPIALQSTADRGARKSVTFQIAVKMAGAIQSVNCLISVNR